MKKLGVRTATGIRADRAMALLLFAFSLAFAVGVGMLALDQQRVLDANSRLQAETVPQVIGTQRLARNLEQLRQEGERIFAGTSPAMRQQSMFIVTLIASHPGILEDAASARLAGEAEAFLGEVVRGAAQGEGVPRERYEAWKDLSARIRNQVDDMSTRGVDLISADLVIATQAMETARYKLIAVLVLLGFFVVVVMLLVRRHLIAPLQRIDRALSGLDPGQPAPVLAASRLNEIQVIEEAVSELHDLICQNDAARQDLEKLANKDGLTGLTNRRHFMVTAEIELQRAQRYRRPVTVGMADLDSFKKLNDTYGHAAGDAVLRAFASLVRDALRQSDLVCRYGGEEFAFLFPEVGPAEAAVLAERLRAACAETDVLLPDGRKVRVTVSLGLADARECPIEIALQRADDALYRAKGQGRNRVVIDAPAEAG